MNGERIVFIVRVWLEHDPQAATAVLRGSLQRLGSDQTRYFASLETLFELMHAALPPLKPDDIDDLVTAVS